MDVAFGSVKKARGSSYQPAAAKAYFVPQRKGGQFQETKYFDVGINATVTSGANDWTDSEVPCDNYVNGSGTAAAYTDSALIPSANGSAYGQVVGNKYMLKKIRVRGRVIGTSASDQADILPAKAVRLLLVLDTQPNGAQAQGEDVMQDIGAAETMYSYMRVANNLNRFRILKDVPMVLNATTSGTDGTNTQTIGFASRTFKFQYTPKTPIPVSIRSGNAAPTIMGLVNCNIFLLLHTEGVATGIAAAARAYYSD